MSVRSPSTISLAAVANPQRRRLARLDGEQKVLPEWEATTEAEAAPTQTTFTRGSASLREGQTVVDLLPLDGCYEAISAWMDQIQDKIFAEFAIPNRLLRPPTD